MLPEKVVMKHLTWSFDWPLQRAVAVASHGTYVITGEAPGRWSAHFTRVDTEPYRRTARPVRSGTAHFATMADAMRACHRHADSFDPDSSDRLKVATPLP
jgi:hypothetical protein